MKSSFRWYGDSDPVTLDMIRQIPGMRSIVSAVYDVKPGEVWPEESIKHLVDECAAHGLIFDVVESIPVTEEIKLGRPERDRHIANYCESIRRCAKYGIKCVTYNFMPVFDWTRTQLDKKAPDGSTSLVMYWDQMKGLDPLKDDIHLPGWDSSYTQDEVRDLIRAYGELGEEGLWQNIEYFLKRVIPVAEECGVVMALHPDDPPYPIFGLPRVITCEENIDRYLAIVDSPANTMCLCTGSLGCSPKNDIPKLVRKYSAMKRIGFMHIRNVKILPDTSFEESGHLTKNGSLDMNAIVKALVETGFDGYFRPDHGRMIWSEVGSAEGVQRAIGKASESSTRNQYAEVTNSIARKGQGTKSLADSRGRASGFTHINQCKERKNNDEIAFERGFYRESGRCDGCGRRAVRRDGTGVCAGGCEGRGAGLE